MFRMISRVFLFFFLLCFGLRSLHSSNFYFFFVCSLQKEPELGNGNEELWTFVIYAGEDHTNTQTLVAFLGLLSTLV